MPYPENTGKVIAERENWSMIFVTITKNYKISITDKRWLSFTTKEMISIFTLWIFHLYIATFLQHLHMEYISLSWYDTPELVVPISISLIEGCCWKGSYWTKGSYWLSWSYYFERFTVAIMTWLTVMEYLCHQWPRICSTCCKHFPVPSSFMTNHRVRS